jgi:hypothetical protein
MDGVGRVAVAAVVLAGLVLGGASQAPRVTEVVVEVPRLGALSLWVEPDGPPCPGGCPEPLAGLEVASVPTARDRSGRVALVTRAGPLVVKVRWPAGRGPWRLATAWTPLDTGPCAVLDASLPMRWRSCDPGLDCQDAGEAGRTVRLPAIGPIAQEAHLVTPEDLAALGRWPDGLRDGVADHVVRSEALPGVLAGASREGWAPAGEGGSRWGEGSTGRPVPAVDEAWYVTMNWAERPGRGRRLLVLNPFTGAAVVASGGWETGPGPNRALGGASEEVHRVLGGGHRAPLVLGLLVDAAAPLGPVVGGCTHERVLRIP